MNLNDGTKVFNPFLFKPNLLSSFSKSNFKEIIKRALFKSLRGKSRLTSNKGGELVSLWPYLENHANKNGVVGVIR
jgi:hypothetical protein